MIEIQPATRTNPTSMLRTRMRPRRVRATRGSSWSTSPTDVTPSPIACTLEPTSGTFFVMSPSLLTPSPSVSIPLPSLLTPSPITSAAADPTRLLPTAGSPAATATTRPLDIGADSSATPGGTAIGVPSLASLGLENEMSMLPDGSAGYGPDSWTSIEPELDAADSGTRGTAPPEELAAGACVALRSAAGGVLATIAPGEAPEGGEVSLE